jgi:flagellar hook-associated protein 2
VLQEVLGAAPDLATASAAGISFKRDGTLSLDIAKFDTAFRTRYQDLRSLFLESRSATDPSVTLESGGGNAVGGTFAVDITAAASQGTLESVGFSGTYDAGATPDSLTITDNQTGTSTQVALTTGMSTGDIVQALQAAFDANGLSITASAAGNEVRLTHDNFGSLAGITVVNTGAGDGASELWAATATDYGSDVAGTIGGFAATGSGQVLVAGPATAAAGLTVRHVGTGTGAAGTVTLALGVGASIERFLDTYLETATGSIDRRSSLLSERGRSLESRISMLETRLNERRASMLRRFNQMEVALGRLQKQTQALTGLLKPASSS